MSRFLNIEEFVKDYNDKMPVEQMADKYVYAISTVHWMVTNLRRQGIRLDYRRKNVQEVQPYYIQEDELVEWENVSLAATSTRPSQPLRGSPSASPR